MLAYRGPFAGHLSKRLVNARSAGIIGFHASLRPIM
jgi:hypothetical protein